VRQHTRAFTLVELMTVVVIVAVVAVVAARLSSRRPRGERGAQFARGLIVAAHEARATALSYGVTTRIRVDAARRQVITEQALPNTSPATWAPLGTTLQAASGVELCDVDPRAVMSGTPAPSCPTTVNTRVCFGPTGSVRVAGADAPDICPTAGPPTGATLFVRVGDDSTPDAARQKWKLVLFPLTGLPRLLDLW
jgi:prepilin-type N-terminal cleavage/methylation domain-containing protein